MDNQTGELSELATLVTTRIQDISHKKNQKEIAQEVGFPSSNVISIIKSGATKLSLDRVPKMAKALELDLAVLMLPALRQFFTPEVISAIRDTFISAETETEREVLSLARNYMRKGDSLTHETRERLKEVFSQNKPSK